MTVYNPKPIVQLLDGADSPLSDWSISGVGWKAGGASSAGGWTARGRRNGSVNMYQSIDTPYKVYFEDGLGGTKTTPTMCPAQRAYQDPNSTESPDLASVDFEDLTSFQMRRPNQNFPTFRDTTTGAIIDALSARSGVTINGDPDLYVSEDEAKGAKLDSILARILKVAAMQSVVAPSGEVNLTAWEAAAGNLAFDWSTRVHSVDARNIFSGQRLGKSTSAPPSGEQIYGWLDAGAKSEALQAPLFGAEADDISLAGLCGSFTTWDGDPGNPASKWLHHQDLEGLGNYPPPETDQGTGVATHFTAVVLPPGGVFAGTTLTTHVSIRVTGTPEEELPDGVDAEFLYPELSGDPDTSLGDWPAPDFIDSLFPSQAYAITRRAHILNQLNSNADKVTLKGPLQCGDDVAPLLRHEYDSRQYKVDSIDWDFESNTTTIVCVRVAGTGATDPEEE